MKSIHLYWKWVTIYRPVTSPRRIADCTFKGFVNQDSAGIKTHHLPVTLTTALLTVIHWIRASYELLYSIGASVPLKSWPCFLVWACRSPRAVCSGFRSCCRDDRSSYSAGPRSSSWSCSVHPVQQSRNKEVCFCEFNYGSRLAPVNQAINQVDYQLSISQNSF